MPQPDAASDMTRRRAAALAVLSTAIAGSAEAAGRVDPASRPKITCFIRYQIDPYRRDAFRTYAEGWARIIPRCGGYLVGYFLPDEGTNDIAWGLIAFDGLAAYEAYRARLRSDPEAQQNFAFAKAEKFILREERSFVEIVPDTFGAPPLGLSSG